MTSLSSIPVKNLSINLERDVFLRTLIRELAGSLQEVVGLEEASGFISLVGQRMGDQINNSYRETLGVQTLSKQQIGEVLVDLKHRIKGNFFILEQTDEKIVFGNNVCPFEEKVIGRPAMCMMTSNVFGVITAQNTGYAKVALDETIAEGSNRCKVVVYLKPQPENNAALGREYFSD